MILFQILLPLLAPLIDLFALYGLVFADPAPVARRLARASTLVQLRASPRSRSGSTASRCGPLWALPLQQFVYRQLMYLVIIESTITALVGARASWRHIPRTGDVEVPPSARAAAPSPTPSRRAAEAPRAVSDLPVARVGDRVGAEARSRPAATMPSRSGP